MKKEMLLQIRKRSGLFITLIALCFFIQGVGASLNDACFTGECHNSTGQSINRTLYETNSHKIIKCIDCHVNSTIDSSPDHGQFIRQFNGSIITGPLTTSYNSESFSLCYYCHAEKNVVGFLPGMIPSSNHVNTTPVIVSSIGTNFINIDPLGHHNGSQFGTGFDIPTNIHWNHLDAFGSTNSGNFGRYDSNKDGIINSSDSYQSCMACHDVHGTNFPKMTKNDIGISYGSDDNGTFGYIGSSAYMNTGGDLYCNGGLCHNNGTTYKYYRNEINIFEDCVSCHIYGAPGDVNITAFRQGEHLNINITEGQNLTNNSDCTTCHFNKDMNRSNISRCEVCHTGDGSSLALTAPIITTHLPAVTKYSCNDCHSKVINDPGFGIVNITSHYLQRPTILSINYCDYCHGPNPGSPFNATNKTIPEFNHDNKSWNGDATCRTCHTNSNAQADPLANDSSSFHDLTTELGDVFNGTKADCLICHVQKPSQFVIAPDPSHNTTGYNATDCRNCHTSGTGTEPQKLHSVTGACIPCHSDNTTRYYVNTNLFGRHKNVNRTDDTENVSDNDCKTCHFGSANNSMPMDLGAANVNNTYFCQDCHTATGNNTLQYNSITDPTLRKMPMPPGHGENNCMQCHIPGYDKDRPLNDTVRYHTHGPLGFVE